MIVPLSRRTHYSLAIRGALVAGTLCALVAVWVVPVLWVGAAVLALAGIGLTLRWPTSGFALLAFSVPWGSGYSIHLGAFPISPTDIVVASLVGAWLVWSVHSRRNPFADAPLFPFACIFLAALIMSVTQAADWHASLREIVKWLEFALVYVSGRQLIRTREQVAIIVTVVAVAGVSQACLGFAQVALHLGPQAFSNQRAFLRAYGSFDQPNPFAGFLNMTLLPALALALLSADTRRRLVWGVAVACIAGGVLASGSRGALLGGLIAVSIVLAAVSRRSRTLLWVGLLALLPVLWLASFGLVPSGPLDRIASAVGVGGVSFGNVTDANYAAVERAAHWLAGVRMFAAHPILGVGVGNYATAYPAFHPRGWYPALEHAHNYYINIAAESGLVGLVSYVLLLGSALWYSCSAIRLTSDGVYRSSALGVTGALIATSVHNIFDVLYVHGMVAFLGLLLALVSVGHKFITSSDSTENSFARAAHMESKV